MPLLSVKDLSIGYDSARGLVRAVDKVCFDIEPARPLGLVGESGCGKTTLGMALMGLLPENGRILNGRIEFDGSDLARISQTQWQQIRGNRIAMIFQAAMNALNPVLRVDEQIREAILAHGDGRDKKQVAQRIQEVFSQVEIPLDRIRDYPHQYSGGMKQRAVIAMALACRPDIIIADEPTTALDVIVQDQILKAIRQIQEQTRSGLVFISHDMAVIAAVCEEICVMYAGQIVEKGTKKEVFSSPAHPYTRILLASYLTLDHKKKVFMPDRFEPADLLTDSSKCRFSVNCKDCSLECGQGKTPVWITMSKTHQVLCCAGAAAGGVS